MINQQVILAERIRAMTDGWPVTEVRMFGGTAFMLNGNMLCCAGKNGLMARVGPDAEEPALRRANVQRCPGTGRLMPGFLLVDYASVEADTQLREWIDLARAYVGMLPAKDKKPKRRSSPSSKSGGPA